MSRAPWPVGLAFGLALAVLVTLAGPLLLFNPWFTATLQSRHHVADALGVSAAEVDRITGSILADLYAGGDFGVTLNQAPVLDAAERSHMQDVSRLLRLLWAVTGVAAAAVVLCAALLWRERGRIGRLMVASAGGVGAIAVVLAIAFAVAFDAAFLAFHAIFFPPGTYLFPAGSELIVLFPQLFWFDAALAAGASIVASAILVTLIGWRLWRRHA
ncbi:MAG: DUF1461 domain-containing protein [Candidatus Limnocylindria bacterium]